MDYQVFARKYRPQNFDDVLGQDHVTRTLKNAIERNRLAHAYLFVGPRGTGKTSTARIIAKALNCDKGPTIIPCGKCDTCREIAAGTSLDVLEIDGASNNGVEQVRELRENVRFAPAHGRFKIYVIDEVHMLTQQAFNALLKTLEEPPEHVKFIFATTEPQKVLPTILSRCQRFDLRRIPATLIAKHLQVIAKKEKIKLDAAAADTIAAGADGGMRDAESMLDQLVAFCGNKVTEEDVLTVFGFTGRETVTGLCGALLERKAADALSILHDQAEAGKDLSKLLADLISNLRNLLVFKTDAKGLANEVGSEMLKVFEQQADLISLDRLLELIDLLALAEGRMKWAPNKKLQFEIAVIKSVQSLGQASLTDVIDTLTELKRGGPGTAPEATVPAGSVQAPRKTSRRASASVAKETSPAAAAGRPPGGEKDGGEIWSALLEKLRGRPRVRSDLASGTFLGIEGKAFQVGFHPAKKMPADALMRADRRKALNELLAELGGRSLEFRAVIRDDMPESGGGKASAASAESDKEDFRDDPRIKKALEIFKGEIQPVSRH